MVAKIITALAWIYFACGVSLLILLWAILVSMESE
jgi:hypothetical protein